jgi:hypothetical protein
MFNNRPLGAQYGGMQRQFCGPTNVNQRLSIEVFFINIFIVIGNLFSYFSYKIRRLNLKKSSHHGIKVSTSGKKSIQDILIKLLI